jgi:hypothetical protein
MNLVPFTACIYYYNPQKSRLNIVEGYFKPESKIILPRPLLYNCITGKNTSRTFV